jgi:hypothetical protein
LEKLKDRAARLNSKPRIVFLFVVSLLLVQTTGCMQVLWDTARSSKATFQETTSAWPEISKGEGRVVIYWPPPTPFREVMKISLDGDKSKTTGLYYKTFVFIDLKAGTHTVEQSYWGKKTEVAKIELKPGEIVFVKVGKTSEVVRQKVAEKSLTEIYHHYKKALPFNVQK